MERTILERNAERGDSLRQLTLQIDQRGRARANADPQHTRRAARRKCAEPFEHDVEWRRVDVAADGLHNGRHAGILDVAEKHQRQM